MKPDRRRALVATVAALAVFGVMAMVVRGTDAWNQPGAESSPLGESPEQLDSTSHGLFHEHVLAFEVLGVLLTAAMIGALVVARPLGAKHDAENYTVPTREQLAESVHQSDVRTHFPEGR